MDGRGVLVHAGSTLYFSHFKNNKFHGSYLEFRSDGTSICGNLNENVMHGTVVYHRPDDTREIREFNNG